MPLFDYKCENIKCSNCGTVEEHLVRHAGQWVHCPECLSPMKKIISAPDGKRVPHISWSSWRVGIGLKD